MSAESKAAALADECLFQDACGRFVSRGVIMCVSSLMYDIGRNIEAASEIFNFDADDAMEWFESRDYEESGRYFIADDADLDQLEEIAENFSYWSDVLEAMGYQAYLESFDDPENEPDDLADWLEKQDAAHTGDGPKPSTVLRDKVEELVGDWEWVCNEYNLDPDYCEVYEHWVVDSYLEARLKEQGETVFDFANMTIWARTTTGQSILLDGVIRQIVRGQDENSYIWDKL